ncbi:hypothetical protein GCM10010873_26720 [Cypionkella aquatica]|uniref:Uncharacterized protein n=1 Tax=Cypionkella aquatica TaxID=1756042 RepID=A0AA37TXG5_9RHOB|nr:hypothetical protein [Cypionkella aquatica]GLS87698.1 hypothetical protein GCM10010873_26720 [Cypionkella aquatica]
MKKPRAAKREMSIKSALEWAFGTEHAQLDFDELSPQGARPGMSTIWLMMLRGALGCQIDGGGSSRPASDAETIAIVLSTLPAALGGKPMAAAIAALARAGMEPDWDIDMTPRCVPCSWSYENQHGRYAGTVVVEKVEVAGKRGRQALFEVRACPVTYVPTAQQIAMVQRRYWDWRLALRHLRNELSLPGVLRHILLTQSLPEPSPWLIDPEKAA